MAVTFLTNEDKNIIDGQINQLSEEIANVSHYVTPQMFGAVADGVADDTEAVQTALDHGGIVYFPSGRYKVTSQLTVSKSCRIEMFKPYPATYLHEYPLTSEDNWMGARIETYATEGYGMLIGDAVEVNGLYLRAMDGFTGVLLKIDTTIGTYTYQAAVRLSRVKLENNSSTTYPESMFDFTPDGSYHYIFDDIAIGRSPSHPRCTYGFRADLSETPRKWCNNVFVRNMCIDMKADYPLYIDGASCAAGWVFDGLTIQAYPFDPGHINLIVLKNLERTLFVGSYLWDLGGVNFRDAVFSLDNVVYTTCIGCSGAFDEIETVLTEKMKLPENLNITNLNMRVDGDEVTGGNILTLSDGTREQNVLIPSVVPSEEQINTSISKWIDEHAAPVEVVGRNKFNASSEDTVIGFYYWANSAHTSVYYDKAENLWTTNYIEAVKGDTIRLSKGGTGVQGYILNHYDADKNFLGNHYIASDNADGQDYRAPVVAYDNTAYVRIAFMQSAAGAYADRETAQICITVNDTNTKYEPYGTTLEGGLISYMILQSPNGSRYSIAVTDDGTLVAEPV